jgi:hypothetical protein
MQIHSTRRGRASTWCSRNLVGLPVQPGWALGCQFPHSATTAHGPVRAQPPGSKDLDSVESSIDRQNAVITTTLRAGGRDRRKTTYDMPLITDLQRQIEREVQYTLTCMQPSMFQQDPDRLRYSLLITITAAVVGPGLDCPVPCTSGSSSWQPAAA